MPSWACRCGCNTRLHRAPRPPQPRTRGSGIPHHHSSNPTLIIPFSLPEFFKFKGFGSLSSIPRSFTFRRASVDPSSPDNLRPHLPPSHSFLGEPFDSTQDDLNTVPKSPGPYAQSSNMYSHMGTMPRVNLGKAGKSLGKDKSSQKCWDKGTPNNKIPQTALVSSSLKCPEMSSTPDPGTDPPSAAGEAEQEEEKAESGEATMARTDQEPAGNVSCPGTEAPSSSLAPNPSQTTSPDTAAGAETTDGDLLEKGQEHPDKISPDRYSPWGLLCLLLRRPFCPSRARGGGWDKPGSPQCPPVPTVPAGCTWPVGQHSWSVLRSAAPWERGFLWDFCSLLFPDGVETSRSPALPRHLFVLRRPRSSTGMCCCGELTPALLQPPPPLTLLFSTLSMLSPSAEQRCLSQGTGANPETRHSVPISSVNPHSGHKSPSPGTISPSGGIWRFSL